MTGLFCDSGTCFLLLALDYPVMYKTRKYQSLQNNWCYAIFFFCGAYFYNHFWLHIRVLVIRILLTFPLKNKFQFFGGVNRQMRSLLKWQVCEIPDVDSCIRVIPACCAKYTVEQPWVLDKHIFVLCKISSDSFVFLSNRNVTLLTRHSKLRFYCIKHRCKMQQKPTKYW